MLTGVITLVRLFWPYLREVIFGRDSVRAWIKKNGITLVWLLFIVMMLVVVLKLVSLIDRESVDNKALMAANTALEAKLKAKEPAPRPVTHSSGTMTTVGVEASRPPPKQSDADAKAQALLNQIHQIQNDEEQ